jgi:hypothetical protein
MKSPPPFDARQLQYQIHWLAAHYTWPRRETSAAAAALVTAYESCSRHGTGVLVQKIFGDAPGTLAIRSHSPYSNENYVGDRALVIAHKEAARPDIYRKVLDGLDGSTVRRVVCLPYFTDDCWNGIVLHDAFDVPLCTYIMDDANVAAPGIPDAVLAELLRKSRLRLVISTEMRDAYEAKFGLEHHVVPPVVSGEQVLINPAPPEAPEARARTGALVGNIWNQRWLDLLRATVRGTGLTLHWFCNAGNSRLQFDADELAGDGIVVCGGKPEDELARLLRRYPYAVAPSGLLDEDDGTRAIAALSLPSRIPFILATSQAPLIVLGHADTAAARFVERLGVGKRCPYERDAFALAVAEVCSPGMQRRLRSAAAAAAPQFSADGLADWLWESLALGRPADERFAALNARV